MANKPAVRYAANSNPADANYPNGSARNSTAPGAKNGYPWDKDQINDWIAFFTALTERAGISLSGSTDTVLVSDYIDALFIEINKSIASEGAKLFTSSDFNAEKKDIITCIPRCTAGVFNLLNDGVHETLGFASVSQPDDHTIRIDYSKAYGQVNMLQVGIDDSLSRYGVTVGASVGTQHSTFIGYAQLTGLLTKTAFTSHALIDGSQDVTVSVVDDVLTLTHDATVTNDVPNVNQSFEEGNMPNIVVGYNSTTITVRAITNLSGLVHWSGTLFEFRPGFPTGIAPDQLSSITFSESNGVLTVNHPSVNDYDIQVSSFGDLGYNVKIGSIGLSSFQVKFYDVVTGAQIIVADANMQVFIKRNVHLKGIIPSNAAFLVRGPRVPIRSVNYSNVNGNNFFVNALMQEPST